MWRAELNLAIIMSPCPPRNLQCNQSSTGSQLHKYMLYIKITDKDIGGGDRRRHEKESHPVVVIAYSLYIETPNQRFRPAFLGR